MTTQHEWMESVFEEEAFAHSLGFWNAYEYHAASDEAFAESVRDDWNGE